MTIKQTSSSVLSIITPIFKALLLLVTFALASCGKYGPPLPPEALSPKAVEQLEVSAQLGEVRFKWRSPKEDRRGKELQFIDGYEVYRASVASIEEFTENQEELSLSIGFLPDTHITKREALREEAREKGIPTRKVEVSSDLRLFEFIDKDLSPGQQYIYKIVPVNQGGIEGEVLQYVRVVYRGDSSEVRFVDQEALTGEL